MSCDDDEAWILERIAAKRGLIVKYEAALDALALGAQSYQLNTGQSQQLVTKANLGSVRLALKELESDLAVLQARLGGGRFVVRPGW